MLDTKTLVLLRIFLIWANEEKEWDEETSSEEVGELNSINAD